MYSGKTTLGLVARSPSSHLFSIPEAGRKQAAPPPLSGWRGSAPAVASSLVLCWSVHLSSEGRRGLLRNG